MCMNLVKVSQTVQRHKATTQTTKKEKKRQVPVSTGQKSAINKKGKKSIKIHHAFERAKGGISNTKGKGRMGRDKKKSISRVVVIKKQQR